MKAKERRQELKEERDFDNAVISLQCRMRVKIGAKKVESARETRKNISATTLQRKARGRAARIEYIKQRKVRHSEQVAKNEPHDCA